MKNEHLTHLNASLVSVYLEMADLIISHQSAKPQVLEYRSMFEKPFQYMRTFLFMQEEGSRLCTQSPQVPSSPHSSNVTNQQGNYSLRRPPKLIIPPMSKVGKAQSYIRSQVQHKVILEVRCSTKSY